MGFNSEFKGLNQFVIFVIDHIFSVFWEKGTCK